MWRDEKHVAKKKNKRRKRRGKTKGKEKGVAAANSKRKAWHMNNLVKRR